MKSYELIDNEGMNIGSKVIQSGLSTGATKYKLLRSLDLQVS